MAADVQLAHLFLSLQAFGAGLLPLAAWSGLGGQRGDSAPAAPESEGPPPPRAVRNALAPTDMATAASHKNHPWPTAVYGNW